jgi:ABC-type multidrug transport system permease subunit
VPVKQLRVVSTVLLAFAVGQAGLGSGYLDGGRWLLVAHAANAFAVLLLAILSAVFGFVFRRSGGPSWIFYFPLALVAVVGIQIALGFAGVRGVHVFLGVLLTSAITMFCSYSWRLPTPHTGNDPRGGRKLTGSDQPADGSTGAGVER